MELETCLLEAPVLRLKCEILVVRPGSHTREGIKRKVVLGRSWLVSGFGASGKAVLGEEEVAAHVQHKTPPLQGRLVANVHLGSDASSPAKLRAQRTLRPSYLRAYTSECMYMYV